MVAVLVVAVLVVAVLLLGVWHHSAWGGQETALWSHQLFFLCFMRFGGLNSNPEACLLSTLFPEPRHQPECVLLLLFGCFLFFCFKKHVDHALWESLDL